MSLVCSGRTRKLLQHLIQKPANLHVLSYHKSRILPRQQLCLVDPFCYFNEYEVPKSWTSKISSFVRDNRPLEAVQVFKEMLIYDKGPNFVTVLSVIKAVGLIGSQNLLCEVHGYAMKMGFVKAEVSVGTALIGIYSSFDMEESWKLFYQTTNKDIVVWSAMISACVSQGQYLEAFKLLREMVCFGMQPNHVTFATILPVCSDFGALLYGKEIHNYCIKREVYGRTLFQNSLVGMYAKFGHLKKALQVFNEMLHKDNISWRIMIRSCVENEHLQQALHLFFSLQSCGTEKVDEFIVHDVIGAYSQMEKNCVKLGFLSLISKMGFTSFVFVVTELLLVYAKFGDIESARNLFDEINKKDLISWSAMIAVYAQSSQPTNAFELFRQMQSAGQKPNEFTFISLLQACASIPTITNGEDIHALILKDGYLLNTFLTSALIDTYCRFGKIRQGCTVFDENPFKDLICWSSMINGYRMNGCGEEVLECFSDMLSCGIEPNDVVFISVLSSCSHCGLEYEGWKWFYAMEERYGITPNLAHYACMVELLSRQGNIEEALKLVNNMHIEPDERIWGALFVAIQNTNSSVEILEMVAQKLISFNPENSSYSVVLSNLYSEQGRWEQVEKLRNMIDKKVMACSTVFSS